MKLLSIDVGIKNLAFCLLRVPDSTQPEPQPHSKTKTQTTPKNKPQNNQFEILLWDVVGISQSEQEEAASLQRAESHPVCCHHTHAKDKIKTTTQCKSRAAYFYYSYLDDEPVFTCKRHAAETKQVIGMTLPQFAKLLKSGSIDRLLEFCNSFISGSDKENECNSEPEPKTKRTKTELIERATHLLRTSCLFSYEHAHASRVSDTTELLTAGSISKKLPSTSMAEMDQCGADNVSLVSVGYNLMQKFDKLFYSESAEGQYYYMPNRVVIENQISPIATRMKTVQGMVTQYFLMRGVSKASISYISATNKLKAWSAMNADAEIDTYDDRKKTGIACVRKMLLSSSSSSSSSPTPLEALPPPTGMTDAVIEHWRTVFESHKKKDDMADSLLQGISCL